ncbi:ATP-binding protein [Bacteriovorax sp. Seq25_V]|uniref:ATP-binding protein n=1 Tax=Bacteriovorax sp. Seq25_V TaxID=1201288 RepID=UPI00038A09EB|nr:ATP-binding protein [Bacteriovorax sp. Seq25_V]EQC43305.1 GHKL domain protein [Bacteriovorax sp. Seq25_V]
MIDFKKLKKIELTNYYPLIFTIVFIVVLLQYKFPALESVFYDFRVKYDIGTTFTDDIVVITLDEESDEFLGENYPYTYTTYLKLLDRLFQDEPKIVNAFGVFNDAITESEETSMLLMKKKINDYQLSGGVFRFATEIDGWGERVPPKGLQEIGYSPAIINIDSSKFSKDDVSRRAVLNVSGEETLHFWTASEYLKLKGKRRLRLNDVKGVYYVPEADASFALFRYYTSPIENKGHLKKVPFHRVVVGNVPRGFFKDKIVLIGPSYISNAGDFLLTPHNKEEQLASKMSLHANIIHALINGKTVKQVPFTVSAVLSFLVAVFLSMVISRIQPAMGLIITIITILGTIIGSYLLFAIWGYWLYMTHLLLTIFVVYYIWVPFRAIGEYQRRYAIQEETKLLKQVENLKQNFISLMSHDLKTPVAKIAGVADNAIQRYKASGDDHLLGSLKSIFDSTKELNNFITSILDLTKVESRNLSINLVSKDVNTIIEAIVDELEYEAKQKEMIMNVELGPLYPIDIDIVLIKRVISNLVENAIKYSGHGTSITVKTWDDEAWVYIEISDSGVGIPEDDIKNIFEKFYRVKNDASHKIKGSGLGLYLVKYFVELHGGTIEASSVLNEGTTFLVKLVNK